jgi:hypothetical protein
MSDTKIQTSNPDDLSGGQTPLSPDQAAGRVRGTDADQNTLSFCRGVEVPASSQPTDARGFSVSGVAVSVAQVGHKALEGSNSPNDFRKSGDVAVASLAAVSGSSKGPRDPVQQAPNGKNCK